MSISAIIQNPQNDQEASFNIPVAPENTFEQKWEPIIEELGLQWVPLFSTGVDLEEIDLPDVLNELDLFKSLYIEKNGHDAIVDRVIFLAESLKEAFSQQDIKVFIG